MNLTVRSAHDKLSLARERNSPDRVNTVGVFVGNKMLIKKGDLVKTAFCTGRVTEIIKDKDVTGVDTIYYRIKVVEPRLHWKKRMQIVNIEEVKSKA